MSNASRGGLTDTCPTERIQPFGRGRWGHGSIKNEKSKVRKMEKITGIHPRASSGLKNEPIFVSFRGKPRDIHPILLASIRVEAGRHSLRNESKLSPHSLR